MSRLWIPLGLLAAILFGTLMELDRRSELKPEPPAAGASVVDGRLRATADAALLARTAALEQLADRCVPDLWLEAERERDIASTAQRQEEMEEARTRYGLARQLYDQSAAQAAARLARGTCMRRSGDGPTLALPEPTPNEREIESVGAPTSQIPPYDPEWVRGTDPAPATQEAAPSEREPSRPRRSDTEEIELRTRATRLVESGQPCEGVALLREQGTTRRTRELAVALEPACRARRSRR